MVTVDEGKKNYDRWANHLLKKLGFDGVEELDTESDYMDNIFFKHGGEEYTLRTWSIAQRGSYIHTDYTLFKDNNNNAIRIKSGSDKYKMEGVK